MTAASILVATAALALRVAAAIGVGRLPLGRTPQYDGLEYLLWAQRLAGGDFGWPPNPPHGPAYPFFLAGLLAAGHGSLMFARMVQAVMGAATCCIAGSVGARLFGARAGIVTAALLAVYAPLIWLDASIGSEGLLMFLLTAALWSGVSERSPILTGALIGLAALTRPTALIFLPLLVWIGARAMKRRTAIVAAAVAVIIPVTIANWRASHAFIPIQAFGGMNVYLGDSPLRDGMASARPGGEWERLEAEGDDQYFTRKTLGEIRAHPSAFAGLLLRKALLTFQNEEVRDTHSFYFFRQLVPVLRWLPGFTILFAFAVAGAVPANWRERNVRIVAICTALAAATCIALVVGARYRIPLALGLALFGGAVAVPQSRRKLAVAAIAGVIAALCTRIVTVPAAHNFAEEWALTAESLLRENQLAEAEAAARRATLIDPSNPSGWSSLGSILGASGRTAEAADAFRRTVTLNPDFATAHQHLAALLAQNGDLAGAAAAYRRVIAIDPRSVVALRALARLSGAMGNAAEGLEAARRAAALETPDDDDWLIIAMLAAELRRFDEADDALAHIAESSPRVEQVKDAIRRARGSP
ncbi:MAG: tetratricopeptide repeat protein [Acidobacteriota bacterium]